VSLVSISDPEALFQRWFVAPLRLLETLENGDGAFVALLVSLALYERFAKAFIKHDLKQTADDAAFTKKLAFDFSISEREATVFWDVMRHGLQHQAMPMQSGRSKCITPRWQFKHELPKPIQLGGSDVDDLLLVQPWLFRDRVLAMYEKRPDLIGASQSFPWASIFPEEPGAQPVAAAAGAGDPSSS